MSVVTSLAQPRFYCPIACPPHAHAERLEQQAIAWLDRFGVYGNDTDRAWGHATRAFDHCCRTCPRAADDRLLLYIEWMYWAFAVDDGKHDDAAIARTANVVDFNVRVARCLEMPVSAPLLPGDDRLTAALADLIERTRAMSSATQYRRLVDGIREWLFAAAWQAGAAERGVAPTLDELAAMRPGTNGCRFHIAMMEITNGSEAPGAIYDAPVMQAACEASSFVTCCDNDRFGYLKDQNDRAIEYNLIDLLARDRRCSVAEALAALVAIRDRVVTLLFTLTDHLAIDAAPEVGLLLDSVRRFAIGSVHWHRTAPRYASPRSRYPLPVPGAHFDITVTDTPSDPSLEPPSIPTIAWWWDQLRLAAAERLDAAGH